MQKHDKIRLKHMLDAIGEALSFAKNRPREALNNDRMLVLALIKAIEIVGEAASRISDETRDASQEIPWVGQRIQRGIDHFGQTTSRSHQQPMNNTQTRFSTY